MSMTPLIIAELVALAVGLMWISLAATREEQQSTARIQQAISVNMLAPALELQASFTQRVLLPLLKRLLYRLGTLSPAKNLNKLQRELIVAGSPYGLSPLDFVGLRILIAGLGIVALSLLLLSASASLARSLLAAVAGATFFAELPPFWLHRRMKQRRKEVTLALPDALDMLTVCVDAGLGLESAFMRIGQKWDHSLAQEFRRSVMEMGIGISWREALRNLVYRTDVPELSSLVAVLLQADQLGFSIADTLHTQAEQLRIHRRQRAQEAARSAPFKMLFPMVFFIMPATFAVIIGPAIPAILAAFRQG